MSGPLVDLEEELNMPGGVGFIDASDVLDSGTKEMEFGTIMAVQGFELSDAMSALEIMDPRMDTGMTDPPPVFQPNTPLLPSEVCWILDRTFACEMSWHTGLALAQTVYTLQYVHHLGDVAHLRFKANDITPARSPYEPEDPERPLELVTLVLRAGIFGLVKCCDLVWREIARDHLLDGEDWNSEKYGVSLCESVQPECLLSLLDEAVTWLRQSLSIQSSPWRDPLIHRLSMRRNIFQTLSYPSFPVISSAIENLRAIVDGPSPPELSPTVLNVFDPAIARRLVSFVPTRAIELPSQTQTWEAVGMWFDQWEEIRRLIGIESLWNLKVLAGLRACEGPSPRRSAFLRSLSISTFFNGSKILLTHDPPWLIDHFFLETAAIAPGMLSRLAIQPFQEDSDSSSQSSDNNREAAVPDPYKSQLTAGPDQDVDLFEKGVARLLVDYFTSFYHNRPRQRRKLAAALLDWHLAFEHASRIAEGSLLSESPSKFALSRLPLCIRHIRLLIIAEVIFSGFELELYARHEWTTMYWYVGEVLTNQVATLDKSKELLLQEDDGQDVREALTYISAQWDYANSLRCFAVAMRDVLYSYPPSTVQISPEREQANFEKRFKWAFTPGYSEARTLDEDRPILGKWRRWQNDQETDDTDWINDALENLLRARDGFTRLSQCKSSENGALFCEDAYREFMLALAQVCESNLVFLRKPPPDRNANAPQWTWEPPRWFPRASCP